MTLENIQLKERLRRKSIENQALENIASLFAANLPPGPLYRRFADEVKQLMHYDRITFYLSDEPGGNLSRVCQLGLGVCRSEPGPNQDLGGAAWESLVSSGTGLMIQDKPQLGPSLWLDLDDNADLRSALIAPSATQVKLPMLLQWKAGGQMPVGRPSWAFCPRPRNS